MVDGCMVQGRWLGIEDIAQIQRLIADNPSWSRRRLSEVLCAEWNWRNGGGLLKDMATRSLLVKLDARGLIQLPERRRTPSNRMARKHSPARLGHDTGSRNARRMQVHSICGKSARMTRQESGLPQPSPSITIWGIGAQSAKISSTW